MLLLLHFVIATYGRPYCSIWNLNIDLKKFLLNETLGYNAYD